MAFRSSATDLVGGGGDTNALVDAFLASRLTGTRALISRSADLPTTTANGSSHPVAISADGRYVLMESTATDLISEVTDTNGTFDLFLWDRDTNLVSLVSRAAGSTATAANGLTSVSSISADGRYVSLVTG